MEINKTLAKKVLEVVDAGLCKGVGDPIPGQMCVEAAVCYAMDLPHGDNPSCVSPAIRSLKIELNDKPWSSDVARAKGLRRLALAQLGSKDAVNDAEFAKRVSELANRKQVPIALRAAAAIHLEEHHKLALEVAAVACETEGTQSAAKSAAWSAKSAESAAESAESAESAKSAAESAKSAAWSAWSAKSAAWSAAWSAKSAAWSAESAAESAAWSAWSAAKSAESDAWSAKSAIYDKVLGDFAEGVVQILIQMKAPGCEFLGLTEG